VFASAEAIYVASSNFRWGGGEEHTLVLRFAIDTSVVSTDVSIDVSRKLDGSGPKRVRYGGMVKAPGKNAVCS
jgi:hypothetical protein